MASSSSKALTARVKIDTKDAIRALDRLDKKIKSINKAVNQNVATNNKLNTAINKATRTATKLNNANIKAANSANKIHQNYKKAGSAVTLLTKKVKALASAYLGVMGARSALGTSDMITSSENRLNNLPGGNQQATQLAMDKMYVSSQNARTGYGDMMSNVSKSMTLAGGAFQNNIDNAIRFQEIMAKSYSIGGASAAEQSSSMYQLIQALGSGILQGDELRSIREGAPIAYKEIEKFAQGVYKTDEALKDLAADGKITSDIVVAAMMNAGESIDKAFENTDMTFAQAFNNIRNTAIKSFEPVLQMLNEGLNSEAGQAIINGIGWSLQFVAGVLRLVFMMIASVYNFIVENWGVISKILINIGLIMLVVLFPQIIAWIQHLIFVIYYYIYLGAVAVGSAIRTAIAWLAVNWQMALIILVIIAIITAIIWLSDSFADACGYMVGIILAFVSIVWNLFVTLVVLIIQWAILPLVTAWDLFANFFGNVFNDPIASVIYAFETLGQSVLGILRTIANCIDAVFGTNLGSAVNEWSEGLKGKADELAERYGNGSYEEKSEAAQKLNEMLSNIQTNITWDTGDAFNTGYDWGATAGQWITDKLGGLGNKLGDLLNMGNLPSGDDFAVNGSYNVPTNSDLLNGVGDTADNTGKMADMMELTQEDLEYLRKVAELEWKKEFTTATIQVDMSNYNTIGGDSDLDGIVTKLADKLYEELDSVANGVYI